MAKLEPKEISLSEINNGNEYENGDIVDARSINSAIEASAYAQGKANQALERAISAGTSVKVNGTAQTVLNFSSDPQSQLDEKVGKYKEVYNKDDAKIAYSFPNGISVGNTLTAQGICTQIRNMDIVFVDTNQGKAILNVQDINYGVNYAGASFTMTNGGNAAITAQLYIWLFATNEIRYIKETAYVINADYTIAPTSRPLIIYKIYGGNQL